MEERNETNHEPRPFGQPQAGKTETIEPENLKIAECSGSRSRSQETLLTEFREWLLAADEAALRDGPDGSRFEADALKAAAPPHAPDLNSFYSALLSLKEEVRRESRQSRRIVEEDAEGRAKLETTLKTGLDGLGRLLRNIKDEADAVERKQALELIVLRDRAALGLQAFREARRRRRLRIWFSKLRPLFGSLLEGQEMLLQRFDETLQARGVTAIPCEEREFDPSKMKAVEVDFSSGLKEGFVTAVLRQGYERNNVVLRPAEVKVAREKDK